MLFGKKTAKAVAPEAGYPQNTGTHYLDVLDAAEAITKPELYLEIGSRSGTSLARRKCSFVGVDPEFHVQAQVFNSAPHMHFMQMTSDAFFESKFLDRLGMKPQMAFIDGMHWFEFALRDFMNSERVMDPRGLVFFHDVLPFTADMTKRDYVPGTPWTGDVWKTILALVEMRSDLRIDVITAAKTGLACVRGLDAGNEVLWSQYDAVIAKYLPLSIQDYGIGTYLSKLNLVAPEDFLRSLSSGSAG